MSSDQLSGIEDGRSVELTLLSLYFKNTLARCHRYLVILEPMGKPLTRRLLPKVNSFAAFTRYQNLLSIRKYNEGVDDCRFVAVVKQDTHVVISHPIENRKSATRSGQRCHCSRIMLEGFMGR